MTVAMRNVTKAYGAVRALAGISADFVPGKVTVIRGPNGSGKSTLLAILGTLTHPSSGSVDYGDLGRGRGEVRRTLGWVGHDSLCYLDLTGEQNIAFAARIYGCDPVEAIRRAVDRFGLGGFVARPVRTYSKGQRQRIALARALVHKPRLLLLDEPSAGLDQSATERLHEVTADEASRGAIVIVVTHDAAFGDALGQSFITLDRGRRVSPPG